MKTNLIIQCILRTPLKFLVTNQTMKLINICSSINTHFNTSFLSLINFFNHFPSFVSFTDHFLNCLFIFLLLFQSWIVHHFTMSSGLRNSFIFVHGFSNQQWLMSFFFLNFFFYNFFLWHFFYCSLILLICLNIVEYWMTRNSFVVFIFHIKILKQTKNIAQFILLMLFRLILNSCHYFFQSFIQLFINLVQKIFLLFFNFFILFLEIEIT